MRNPCKIELLPYHALGAYKYAWLGKKYLLDHLSSPPLQDIEELSEIIKSIGCEVEIIETG